MNLFLKRYAWVTLILLCITSITNLYAQCDITATSSGATAGYTQVYVLVDANGDIVAQNTTGVFNSVANGVYNVHALNYNPADAPSPLPSALIGQPVSDVGSVTAGCYNADFLTDYVVRTCASCVRTTTICDTDDLVAISSGARADFVQMYVLVDAGTNQVVATNTTGIFTGMVTAGTNYQVHALNYDAANAPNPLPTVGQDLTAFGSVAEGCYNADYLTDYLCFNVISCDGCVSNSTYCSNDNIVVTSSGSASGYTQVYVLVDAATDLIVATNSTGDFTGLVTVGVNYKVMALNYRPDAVPDPLPVAGADVNLVGTTTPGCFNSDFLTDYVCFDVIDCSGCFQSVDVCVGEDITATSSGAASGYTQVYVLTDQLGGFIAQNTTGVFSTTDLGLTSTNVYHVYALNYNPADPPSPLPSAMSAGDLISTISGGCMNADFTTDYVCINVNCEVLPVQLLSFEGEVGAGVNILTWSTSYEDYTSHFELQRSVSNTYNSFETIANVESYGHSAQIQNYHHIDEEQLNAAYYRLKLVDAGGDFSYSNTVFLAVDASFRWLIYPNPTQNELKIDFAQDHALPYSISITNMLGVEVMAERSTSSIGQNNVTLDLSHLKSAVYYVAFTIDGVTYTKSFVKN